jgi:hypothetical protein
MQVLTSFPEITELVKRAALEATAEGRAKRRSPIVFGAAKARSTRVRCPPLHLAIEALYWPQGQLVSLQFAAMIQLTHSALNASHTCCVHISGPPPQVWHLLMKPAQSFPAAPLRQVPT